MLLKKYEAEEHILLRYKVGLFITGHKWGYLNRKTVLTSLLPCQGLLHNNTHAREDRGIIFFPVCSVAMLPLNYPGVRIPNESGMMTTPFPPHPPLAFLIYVARQSQTSH